MIHKRWRERGSRPSRSEEKLAPPSRSEEKLAPPRAREPAVPIDVTSLYDRRADNRWDRVCVGAILERVTWSRPDQVAIVGWAGAFAEPECERLTYRQANDIVNRFANGLLARGLKRGDRVLLVCENSVEAYLVKLATAKAGLVAVPVNPSLAPDVLGHLVALAEPSLVVVDAELWPQAGAGLP